MLKDIVRIITQNNASLEDGTIFIDSITIDSTVQKVINFLIDNTIIENDDYENKIGLNTSLELSHPRLNAIGYYENTESFIVRNKYTVPGSLFYINELKCYSDNSECKFIACYKSTIQLIEAIKHISKHNFTDVDVDIAIVYSDDKSLVIPFKYSFKEISELALSDTQHIQSIIVALNNSNSERKNIFINELIDFCLHIHKEEHRFTYFLSRLQEYVQISEGAFQYYLRDFSFNKFKLELDSKILEFTQKIQSVINDSQTKLVTIPTAFVLAVAAFDFDKLYSIKNIATIISLFIFSVILQTFLNNQFSMLRFISNNINTYKETFDNEKLRQFANELSIVDAELLKQKRRLRLVVILLWMIPTTLFCVWIVLISFKEVSLSTIVLLLTAPILVTRYLY